jgi:hypothetical protein
MIGAAVLVGGVVFFLWHKKNAAAAALPAGQRPAPVPYFAPPARLPAIVAGGGWSDASGTHIPTALRTPAEQLLAVAAELRANTGASHF